LHPCDSIMIAMLDASVLNLSIFQELDRSKVNLIAPILEACDFPENTTIFRQDQEASFLYILTSGEVVVRYKPYDGEELTIAHVCPQGVFGWSAALGRPKYTSSAYSPVASKAIRIRVDRLQRFCEKNPGLGMILLDKLASGIAERLKSTHDEVLDLLTRGLVFKPEK
jgi:CRP/FNR family transcriptional regulator, cyclic AMP receptor protein